MRFFEAIIFCFFVFVPFTTAYEGDKRVELMFKFGDTEFRVIEVHERYRDPDDGSLAWSDGDGDAGWYWGTERDGFYKLHAVGTRADLNSKELVLDYDLSTPSVENLLRMGEMQIVTCRNPQTNRINRGSLSVTCEGKSISLSLLKGQRRRLSTAITTGDVSLFPLPKSRKLEHVFKIPHSDSFIVIDSARYGSVVDSYFETFVSKNGKIQAKEEGVWRLHLGGESTFHLESGDTLTSSKVPGEPASATLTLATGNEKPLEELPLAELTPEFIASLGLSPQRYKPSPLRTPCDLLLLEGRFD